MQRLNLDAGPKKQLLKLVSQVEHVALRGACAPIQSTSYPMGMDHSPLLNGKSRRGKSIDSYSFCDIRCLPETLS